MALAARITCTRCSLPKDIMYSPTREKPTICDDCAADEAEAKKKAHLDAFCALPIEEQLRKLAEKFYDMEQNPPWATRFF